MSNLKKINNKIFSIEDGKIQVTNWKKSGKKIVFTNGCFDIIHRGHIEMLAHTADLGDRLIVGLNSDSSIKKIKGKNRPIIHEQSRAILLAALNFIDAIIIFSEENPINLITTLKPNVIAKGGDYKIEDIVGQKAVKKTGGEVIIIPYIDELSSTNIITKIKQS